MFVCITAEIERNKTLVACQETRKSCFFCIKDKQADESPDENLLHFLELTQESQARYWSLR